MRLHRPVVLAVVLSVLLPSAARAHDHTADFCGAFSFASASKLFGLHETLAFTTPALDEDLAIVTDLSIHIGEHDDEDLTRLTFLGGIRYTPTGMRKFNNVVHFHLLVGGVHDGAAEGSNEPALAFGAGYEFLAQRNAYPGGWAFRVQGDYVVSGGEDFPRFSAGIVYRMKK